MQQKVPPHQMSEPHRRWTYPLAGSCIWCPSTVWDRAFGSWETVTLRSGNGVICVREGSAGSYLMAVLVQLARLLSRLQSTGEPLVQFRGSAVQQSRSLQAMGALKAVVCKPFTLWPSRRLVAWGCSCPLDKAAPLPSREAGEGGGNFGGECAGQPRCRLPGCRRVHPGAVGPASPPPPKNWPSR